MDEILYLHLKNELIDLYKLTPNCISYGDYTLASGRHSKYYIDSRQVTLNYHGLEIISSCLSHLIKKHCIGHIDCIGGMTLGADPLLTACLLECKKSGFIVRKESKDHGTKKQIEGLLQSWHQVAIVEDVTTTGGTILEVIKALRDFGVTNIGGAFTVIDRGYGADEMLLAHGIKLHSILTAKDLRIEG